MTSDDLSEDLSDGLPHQVRLAPTFASFDPTDLAAIDHVKRLYNKYPKMWRGIGELMCRHDDLTMMLLDKEVRSPLMTL